MGCISRFGLGMHVFRAGGLWRRFGRLRADRQASFISMIRLGLGMEVLSGLEGEIPNDTLISEVHIKNKKFKR